MTVVELSDNSVAALAARWRAALEAELPRAGALRRELHARPEVSGRESWTALRVAGAIGTGWHHPPTAEPVAGTGRILRIGPASGPCVAIRAELDALPVYERTGAEFAAVNGAMHACGHDVHLAAVAAVARAAHGLDLPAALLVILQPREEAQPSGARDIIADGDLAGHDLAAVIGAHLQPQVPVGTAAADPGVVNAAVDEVQIEIRGFGGHSAYPQLTRDPVPVLCRSILALQDALRTAVDPMQPGVAAVTLLSAGDAPNVIPDTATARGTLRTFRAVDRDRLHQQIEQAVHGIAAAGGCEGIVRFSAGEPPLYNDPMLAAAAASWLAEAGLPVGAPFRSCGSDDFSHYGSIAPSLMIFVGAGTGPGSPMLHDAAFLPADDRVGDVARAYLAGYLAAVDTLVEHADPVDQ